MKKVVYRTDRTNQKVRIPVKPGKRYRFKVVTRSVGQVQYLGTTSRVVRVPR